MKATGVFCFVVGFIFLIATIFLTGQVGENLIRAKYNTSSSYQKSAVEKMERESENNEMLSKLLAFGIMITGAVLYTVGKSKDKKE